MASEKVTALIEEIKTLTVLDLSELVHALEDEFGVSAAPVAVAGGAAPAAPYVILSFLFEIVVEFMFLVCAIDVICSSIMLVRMISLISASAVMIYLLFITIIVLHGLKE